jgi:hypothetical protein
MGTKEEKINRCVKAKAVITTTEGNVHSEDIYVCTGRACKFFDSDLNYDSMPGKFNEEACKDRCAHEGSDWSQRKYGYMPCGYNYAQQEAVEDNTHTVHLRVEDKSFMAPLPRSIYGNGKVITLDDLVEAPNV